MQHAHLDGVLRPRLLGDADGSGTITINEIISAVNNALSGCVLVPATPTVTPGGYPARGYQGPFVGLFLPIDVADEGTADLVAQMTTTAKSFGLDSVNLVAEWRHLEPEEGAYNLARLERCVREVKQRGLACIARVYTNMGPWRESYPAWLKNRLTDTYVSVPQGGGPGGFTQPMPFDPAYGEALRKFLDALKDYFSRPEAAAPDLWQIAVGGEYGEMVLASHPQVSSLELGPVFSAEVDHVAWHTERAPAGASFILMGNSLWAANPNVEDTVPTAAYAAGVRLFQSNAGIRNLDGADYGSATLAMLARAQQRGFVLILEDESSAGPVTERLDRIRAKEQEYGIRVRFRGTTLRGGDLTEANRVGIQELSTHVKQP